MLQISWMMLYKWRKGRTAICTSTEDEIREQTASDEAHDPHGRVKSPRSNGWTRSEKSSRKRVNGEASEKLLVNGVASWVGNRLEVLKGHQLAGRCQRQVGRMLWRGYGLIGGRRRRTVMAGATVIHTARGRRKVAPCRCMPPEVGRRIKRQ